MSVRTIPQVKAADHRPQEGERASRATTVYFAGDDRNLYAVSVCKETPSVVRANLTKREVRLGRPWSLV